MGGPVVSSHRPGPTCVADSFQMGHPGTTPLPAPCSPGICNSSREVDALDFYKLGKLVGREGGRLWLAKRALAPSQPKLA